MKKLIKNATIVNEGNQRSGDILINKGRIIKIDSDISEPDAEIIDVDGHFVLPGIIDDQVHFREPGLTHKASIYTESRAAAAGGVTSYMEMPNVKPATLTQDLLTEKYNIGARDSLVNYSYYMGVSNDNLEEALKTDPKNVCGLKIFMGSSTGNMLVDDQKTLEAVFSRSPMLIATHCEDEATVRANLSKALEKYDENIPFDQHPVIRDVEACYISSSAAVSLAKKHNTRLHILHLTTDKELDLFDNTIPLSKKRITSEVCVHHLYFDASQYSQYGSLIKCNPAIKAKKHQDALWQALLDDRLDIIATDHAPHTWEEKQGPYNETPSGLPLIQHTLNLMLQGYHNGKISIERIVEKMCHAPAQCFHVKDRGYLREGYFADLVVVDLEASWEVTKDSLFYKCGWSPLEGHKLKGRILETYVNGTKVFDRGALIEAPAAMRLAFEFPNL